MVAISRAACALGACDKTVPDRIESLVRRHGLHTDCRFTADEVFAEALHDKKRTGDSIDLVIPHRIGACSIDRVPLATFSRIIAEGIGSQESGKEC